MQQFKQFLLIWKQTGGKGIQELWASFSSIGNEPVTPLYMKNKEDNQIP